MSKSGLYSVRWLTTGESIPRWIRQKVGAPIAALACAAVALLLGIAGSLFAEEIRTATSLALRGEWHGGGTHWLVVVFWIGVILWGFAFYVRLLVESARASQLQSAIHRCPNPRFIPKYGQYCRLHAQELAGIASLGQDAPAIAKAIRNSLRVIAEMAAEFTGTTREGYGANVMLVERPDGQAAKATLYPQYVADCDINAILVMNNDLVVHDLEDGEKQTPVITLQVPRIETEEDAIRLALPGAPYALATGKLSVYGDTRDLEEDHKNFGTTVRDAIRKYFAEGGTGASVRSFASMRIGDDEQPVGVLNIDRDAPFLLGEVREYHETFQALLVPLMVQLRDAVAMYAKAAATSR